MRMLLLHLEMELSSVKKKEMELSWLTQPFEFGQCTEGQNFKILLYSLKLNRNRLRKKSWNSIIE